MPERVINITKCDTTWQIQDAGAVNVWAPLAEVGDFGYAAPLYDIARIRNRCSLYAIRKGDQQPVTTSATVNITDMGSVDVGAGGYASLPDICEERGWWAANAVSTTVTQSNVPTWDQVVVFSGAPFGIPDHTLTFPDMFFRGTFSSGDPSTYAITGESATANKPVLS